MKKISLNLLVTAIIVCCVSCNEQTGYAEQSKTVRAYSPEMNNMEMLSMTHQIKTASSENSDSCSC